MRLVRFPSLRLLLPVRQLGMGEKVERQRPRAGEAEAAEASEQPTGSGGREAGQQAGAKGL
jgi:hypothetical protein